MSCRSRLVIAEVTIRPLRSVTGKWTRATKRAATSGLALVRDEFGPPPGSAPQGFRFAPRPNLAVIAAEQDLRHAHSAELLGPRVLRIFEQIAVAEGFLGQRF